LKQLFTRNNMKIRLSYLAFVTVSFLLLAEVSLRVLGWNSTYMERSGSWVKQLITPISGSRPVGQFHTYHKNISLLFGTGEFQYTYKINALGVRENKDSFLQSPDSTYRILTLGDSFTEGVGADYPYSWPQVMKSTLNKAGIQTEVFNAGVSGSDIWYLFHHLENELFELKPDLVIVALNNSDITDYIIRGGRERFKKDGRVIFRKMPWWRFLYRTSHLARAVIKAFGYNDLLIKETQIPAYIASFKKDAESVSDDFQKLADRMGYSILFVTHPVPTQLKNVEPDSIYGYLAISGVSSYWDRQGYSNINLWDGLNENIGEDRSFKYSWPIDKHFNSDGYRIMGKLIADSLIQKPELLTRD
jgi:lysophospholipase L1-like esterase